MRSRLAREKNTHFTYSENYLAAAVSMVDAPRLALDEAAASRAQWMTKRGFVYPAPKKVSEFLHHPLRPTDARIDALSSAWVENEAHPSPMGRSSELPFGQPDFDTIPSQGEKLFGGLHVPKFERPYDNANLGSERRLPRGRMILDHNPDFFTSVHLTGSGLAQEKAENKRLEEEAWKSKVVVDHLDFKVGGYNVRDRPLQINKTDDILKGPALSKGIRIVRNAKLPSGKKVPLRALPISALSSEPYEDPRDFTADLRPSKRLFHIIFSIVFLKVFFADDFSTFIAKGSTGDPVNFVTAIHRGEYYPQSQRILSHTAIPPMLSAEKNGVKWANI